MDNLDYERKNLVFKAQNILNNQARPDHVKDAYTILVQCFLAICEEFNLDMDEMIALSDVLLINTQLTAMLPDNFEGEIH